MTPVGQILKKKVVSNIAGTKQSTTTVRNRNFSLKISNFEKKVVSNIAGTKQSTTTVRNRNFSLKIY